MKLHTVFITFNRLELTKVAISSFLETVTLPFSAIVIDNASTDGTLDWLAEERPFEFISLGFNKYPGYACNHGWEWAPADATHLQRADNDMRFLPGWCGEVERAFRKRRVGQVGLRTAEEERHQSWNTGGNCVIRAELFDAGLRYDERPWRRYPPGHSEDTYFSPEVKKMGWNWTRVQQPCLEMLSPDFSEFERWKNDPYYQKSFGDRRIGGAGGRKRRSR